ncbi:hypothetical protein A1F94_002202 [Pyrenophora tritici-repentis]|nr:hypothetical protein A1F94_002202 [Pyrenophora tritici-repentis]
MSISNNSRLGLVHYNGEYEEKGKLVGGFGDLSISAENSSPYANGQMITLEVGSEATRFLVHDKVLSRSEVLAAKYRPRTFAGKSVRLPELDQTTAHTLIDYLYTGRYQTLSTLASSDTVIPEGYTLSGCVYCAAVRYDLPGLATLARNKIRSFNISIFDVLSVARDHTFPLLPEWDTWYQTYVEEALNRAMAEDPEPFRKPDFISMVEVPVERPVAVEESVPVPIPMDGIVETAVVTANVFTEFKEEESLQMEEIEPTAEFPPTPEPFTDELGFGSSKTYQKMCKRSDQLGADGVSPTEPEASAHVRFDSVMQVEQKAIKPVVEANVVAGASVAGDSPRQVPIEGREAFPIPKKSKKAKKSKKLPKAPIEVESST